MKFSEYVKAKLTEKPSKARPIVYLLIVAAAVYALLVLSNKA